MNDEKPVEEWTRDDIVAEVKRMDPTIKRGEFAFRAAMFMIASLIVGPDPKKISKLTGIYIKECKRFASRLEANEVWKDGKIHIDWFNPETGGIAFWVDTGVAMGYIERVRA